MTSVLLIIAYIMGAAALTVLVWGVMLWILMAYAGHKIDVDRYEDGAQSDKDVWRIVEASRPAPLDEQERVIRAARSAWMDQA